MVYWWKGWDGEDDDRTTKAAVMGIRLAEEVKRNSEWSCLPAAGHKCSCGRRQEHVDISCELTSIEGAGHPRSGRPLCASRMKEHGHNCQGSTLFLDVEGIEDDRWMLSLTSKDGSLERIAALDISFQYCV